MATQRLSPLLVAFIVLMMVPAVLSIFTVGASLAYISLPVLALAVLAWFVWRTWGRILWRANHINHIRERRLLDEAARR